MIAEYTYVGDRHTSPLYKSQPCIAVRRPDGKCIRGRNGNMLVEFATGTAVVMARMLRKVKPNKETAAQECDATKLNQGA